MIYRYTLDSVTQGPVEIQDPINWEDAEFITRRDPMYHGVFFDFALPLKLIGNGYDYIKTAYDADRIHAEVSIQVEYICDNDISGIYTSVFVGKINFGKIKFTQGNYCQVDVTADPQGPVIDLKNNSDIKYPFLYDEQVRIEAKEVEGLSEFSDATTQAVNSFDTNPNTIQWIKYSFDTVAHNDFAADPGGPQISTSSAGLDPILTVTNAGDYRFYVNAETDLVIQRSTSRTLSCGGGVNTFETASAQLFLQLNGAAPIPISVLYSYSNPCAGSYTAHTFNINDASLTTLSGLVPGDEVRMFYLVQVGGAYAAGLGGFSDTITAQNDSANNILIRATIITSPAFSNHSVAHLYDAWQYILTAAAPSISLINSVFFTGCGGFLRLCSGYSLRGNGAIKPRTSFNEIFKSIAAIYNIGISIEGDGTTYYLDSDFWYNYYQTGTAFSCDNAAKIETTFSEKDVFNEVKVGYDKSGEFAIGSAKDLFGKRTYSTKSAAIKTALDASSSFIASDILIDQQRQGIGGVDGLPNDDDIFVLVIKEGSSPPTVYKTNVGLGEPTGILNYPITPARNALRQLAFATTGQNTLSLFFESSDKDVTGQCGEQASGPCIIENNQICEDETLNYTDIDTAIYQDVPIFNGNTVTAEVPMTVDEYLLLKANKYQLVKVRRDVSEPYKSGWIRDVKYKPNKATAVLILIEQL